jgi:hypothetical protein
MEVALAATVLALTLVGMIQVIESGSEMLDVSRKQTIAAQILHGEIDQVRLQNWTTITNLPATVPAVPVTGVFASILAPFNAEYPAANFSCTVVMQVVEPSPSPALPPASPPSAFQLLQITFATSWVGITGHTYTRYSTTYVSQNGLYVAYQRS